MAVASSLTLVIAIANDAPLAVVPLRSVSLVALALKYAKVAPIIATSTDAGKTISGTVTVTASTGANVQAEF